MSGASVSAEQRRALRTLWTLLPTDAYLAGGVAIAARFGHRVSRDLDWFTSDSDPEALLPTMANAGATIVSLAKGTLYVEMGGIPASVIRYRYPLLAPTEPVLGVNAASLEDLSCMKLSAIASRGMARDFWDLREILSHTKKTLSEALESYRRKYVAEDVGHVIRSLVYFGDADAAPLPSGLRADTWAALKKDFESRVLEL